MLTHEEHEICILKKVLWSRHPHHPSTEGAVVAWGHKDHMDYTKLGNTGMDVSRICLGCMGFGDAERWIHK
jgi:hypothetical protein